MNRTLLLLMISFLFLHLVSCENEKSSNKEMQPVSNVTYEAQPGKILFRWENPSSANLSYTEITFKKEDHQDDMERILVSGKKTEQLIYGLPDTNFREYTFITNYEGASSEKITIQAKAQETPFDKLVSSVKVSLNLNGIKVSWDNKEEGEYYLNMNIDSLRVHPAYEIVIKETGKGERQIPIFGIFQAKLLFTVGDAFGNVSEPVSSSYKKLENGWLDRGIWSVVGFSSQEDVNEQLLGGLLNSRASCVLDGFTNTFWHTKWSAPVSNVYPHHIIFDLKREMNLTQARIVRRLNNTNLNTFQIQGGPSPSGPWTKIAEYVILANNNPQIIPFLATAKYRYIRFYCTKGSGHASLAEFELYGQDIEEE